MQRFIWACLVGLPSGRLALAGAGWAADDCAGTQAEMNRCGERLFQGEDRILNRVYGELLDELEPERREALRTAQRAWIACRDAQCEFDASMAAGGSMQPGLRAACLAQLTRARTAELLGDLDWAVDLAALLSAADDALSDVFWLPTSVGGDFDGDGVYDTAHLGIDPGDLQDPDPTAVPAVLAGGADDVAVVGIPVDGGDGLCVPPVELRVEHAAGETPLPAVDDGACDAFRFRLEPDRTTFTVFRN